MGLASIPRFVTVLLCGLFVYLLSFSPRCEIQVATVARLTDGGEGNLYYLNNDSFTFQNSFIFSNPIIFEVVIK